MYQPFRSIVPNLIRPLMIGMLLSLTSCDAVNLDSLLSKDKASTQTDKQLPAKRADGSSYCERATAPFNYNLCSVNQQELSTNLDATGLHLKLFWRPKQASQNGNDVDNDSVSNSEASNNSTVKNDTAQDDTSKTPPLYRFEALKEDLPDDDSLIFAVNAGMYNSEFAPIGYTVINGEQIRSLNLKEGGGNFHMMPNGVLWWNKSGNVHITESQTFNTQLKNNEAKPWFATQSGPMLVIDGHIHPKFNADSTSLKFRNGVGVCTDGEVKFVNSGEPVNFYQFASLFKDTLGCPNALFLDGGIASALYAPEIDVADGQNMGVMVGLVENK